MHRHPEHSDSESKWSPSASLVLPYFIFCAVFFALFKYSGSLITSTTGNKVVVMLDSEGFITPAVLALAAGAAVTWLMHRLSPLWTPEETKRASGYSLGLIFFAGACSAGGTCILPALVGTIGGLFLLIPFHVGSVVWRMFSSLKKPDILHGHNLHPPKFDNDKK